MKVTHPWIYGGLDTAGTRYFGPGQNAGIANTTEGQTFAVIPANCTIRNLYVQYGSGGPGAGTSVVFTIRKYTGGAWGDAISCTLSNTSTTANSASSTATFAAGDCIALQTSISGSPTARACGVSIEIEADDATYQILLGCTAGLVRSSDASTLYMLQQGAAEAYFDESYAKMAIPAAGTISRLYIAPDQSIGGGGKSYTTTLRVNGADDTTVQVVSTTTTALSAESDTSGTVSVSRGDMLGWKSAPSGTPTKVRFGYGCVFIPTTAGDAVYLGLNDPSSTGERFQFPIGYPSRNTDETLEWSPVSSTGTVRDLYAKPSGSPSPGTYAVTVRKNGSASSVTATISSATAAEDTSNTVDVVAGDYLTIHNNPASSPASIAIYPSFVFRVAAAGGTTRGAPFGARGTAFNGGRTFMGILR